MANIYEVSPREDFSSCVWTCFEISEVDVWWVEGPHDQTWKELGQSMKALFVDTGPV